MRKEKYFEGSDLIPDLSDADMPRIGPLIFDPIPKSLTTKQEVAK